MEIIAPDGVEIGITIYATSDSAGVNTEIKLSGMSSLKPLVGEGDPSRVLNGMLPDFASDWRLMTAEEVVDYKKGKEEAEREAYSREYEL